MDEFDENLTKVVILNDRSSNKIDKAAKWCKTNIQYYRDWQYPYNNISSAGGIYPLDRRKWFYTVSTLEVDKLNSKNILYEYVFYFQSKRDAMRFKLIDFGLNG